MSKAQADKSPKKEDNNCSSDLKDAVISQDLIKEIPSDGLIIPAELNTFLLRRIRELKSENGHLRQEVDEAKDALQNLQKSSALEVINASKKSTEAAATEILSLSEKCKNQTTKLEDFEAKCTKLEEELVSKEIELKNERLINSKADEKRINSKDSETMTEEETINIQNQLLENENRVRILTEKLKETQAKLCETENTCTSLRQEITKVQKVCDMQRDLKSENDYLRQEVNEAKEALQKLQKSCTTEAISALEKLSEVAETQIMELNKKCKDQEMEIEIFKERCKKMETELASKKDKMKNKKLVDIKPKDNDLIELKDSATMTEKETISNQEQISENEDRVRILTEKLQQANAKLYETKNTCMSLRQEVNKAQKLLCREVGESVSIASLSNRSSGWRGRAEQVQHLQQKVADLQSKLNEIDRSTSKGSSSCSAFTVLSEQRNIDYLRNLEKERRRQIENAARDLQQAELALEGSQKKLQAARARTKVLENEVNNLKTNLALLNEKRIHDDQLIEALNGQLKAVEERYREREHEARYQKEKAEESCLELQEELSAVRMQVELLHKKLEERETEIDNLRNGTARNKSEKVWPSQPPKILQPISAVQSRPETPRSFKDPNEYVTLSMAAEAERQRLFELVTVLNRRLDKERTDTDQISELLRQERNKNAKMETRLQRLEMERVGMAKVNTGYRAKCSKSFANLASRENLNAEKIQFKLELLEEECLALKARLTTVQQDKATDLAIYKKMLEQARRTFQDAFRGKMNYTAGCHSNVTI